MKKYTLKRRYFPDYTFSTLHCEDDSQICYFVERAWKNNRPSVSCVPEGTYNLAITDSPKFGRSYYLESEPLGVTLYGPSIRTHILIHKANTASELQGCLAPGMGLGYMSRQWAVTRSGEAFKALMFEFGGETVTLKIEAHRL